MTKEELDAWLKTVKEVYQDTTYELEQERVSKNA